MENNHNINQQLMDKLINNKVMDKHLMIHGQHQVIHATPILIVTMVNVAQNGDIVDMVISF
jgi:hypothetical protein